MDAEKAHRFSIDEQVIQKTRSSINGRARSLLSIEEQARPLMDNSVDRRTSMSIEEQARLSKNWILDRAIMGYKRKKEAGKFIKTQSVGQMTQLSFDQQAGQSMDERVHHSTSMLINGRARSLNNERVIQKTSMSIDRRARPLINAHVNQSTSKSINRRAR